MVNSVEIIVPAKDPPSQVGLKSIEEAESVKELNSALDKLLDKQASYIADLELSISTLGDLDRHVNRLDYSRARLDPLILQARSLRQTKVHDAAGTAGRISRAVEGLDLEQARVKATLEVVDEVAELKACILGVHGSMGAAQDWETAAEYLHRASRISKEIVKCGFAEEIVPTAEVPDAPSVTLYNAAESLCGLFLREFERAVQNADGPRITRFFKMFPLIGRSEEGLGAYGKYVCQGVATRARAGMQATRGTVPSRSIAYVGALTKLFEHIAQVIDGHSMLVERHYGEGTMVRVIERLHTEASVQGGIILDTWNDERLLDRKLTDIKSYAFSFLVQSFLPQRTSQGTPRSQSPAIGASAVQQKPEKDDGSDLKEVDEMLGEIVTMLGRWSLYLKFITLRALERDPGMVEELVVLEPPAFFATSGLPKKINKILLEPYNVLATFFFRRSVEKAFQLDEAPSGLTLSSTRKIDVNPPFITSAVDDIMFIFNQIVQRTLATSQAGLVVDVITTLGRVLGSDFIGMIQRKMRDESYPKASIQGALPPEDKIIAFLVLNNNLDVSMGYVERIVQSNLGSKHGSEPGSSKLEEQFPMNRDAAKVSKVLQSLEVNFSSKASELIGDGISVAFLQICKPKMRIVLAETFRELDLVVGEERLNEQDSDDVAEDSKSSKEEVVKHKFQSGWDSIMLPIKRILTSANFDRLLTTCVSYLSKVLEKRIWNYQGKIGDFGAVALERNISEIASIAVRGGNYKLRELFNRCLQVVTIMNMDDEEWEALKVEHDTDANEVDDRWELDLSERQRSRALLRRP